MKSVDVSFEDVEPPDWLPDLAHVAAFALERVSVPRYDVSIFLCSESRISELNALYRNVAGPTDVLSFSQSEGDQIPIHGPDGLRGDVVISLETVQTNAVQFNVSKAEEVVRAAVHGILHLSGYAHEGVHLSDGGTGEHPMFAIQEQIVCELAKEQNE